MLEIHPFESFVPKNCRYLLLGSFPSNYDGGKEWFYGSKRNQFWPIFEQVYNAELNTIEQKKKLLNDLGIAITDVIYKCVRKKGKSVDANLTNITYNLKLVREILENNKIAKIYFTSKFVENIFQKKFKDLMNEYLGIELITLPSPSPRYAAMKFSEKVKTYRKLLPKTGEIILR